MVMNDYDDVDGDDDDDGGDDDVALALWVITSIPWPPLYISDSAFRWEIKTEHLILIHVFALPSDMCVL